MPAVKLAAILSMTSSGKCLGIGNYDFKVSRNDGIVLTYTTIPLNRGVLGITISHFKGNWPSQNQKWWFSTPANWWPYCPWHHRDFLQKTQLTRMQCKGEKNCAKYWNFHKNKNVQKYTLKWSWRPETKYGKQILMNTISCRFYIIKCPVLLTKRACEKLNRELGQ